MKPTVKSVWGDVLAVSPPQIKDHRGFFSTDFSLHWDLPMGPVIDINRSFSVRGTIRGLHLQTDIPQGKLVRAVSGHILDVFLDLRPSRETFGKASSYHLSANARGPSEWLWVPPGFAHGFQALEDSHVEYLVDASYSPETQVIVNYRSVADLWDKRTPIVISPKDDEAPMFEEALVHHLPNVVGGLEKLSWEGR